MKIAVLGCGRWGSFLAWYQNYIGNKVLIYGLSDAYTFLQLKENRRNEYLELNNEIELTSDLQYALNFADIIIISISSQALRVFLSEIKKHDISKKTFIFCMKGIESKTGKRLTQIAIELGYKKSQLAVWVGPGHIQTFLQGIPNCMVIDSYEENLKKDLVDKFSSKLIRFYYGNDIIGTEIGSATKNIFGLVAGMLDGTNLTPLKGALMSRGCREVSRLIKAQGGNELSAYGLCHLGDYETTLFSKHSHNRMWGELFIKGEEMDEHKLAEGVETTNAVFRLAHEFNIDMPITFTIHDIINKKIDPKTALDVLFSRKIKHEFY